MASGDAKHGSLARLAESLERYGYGPEAMLVARGVVSLLRDYCWRNRTDVIGTAEELDSLCNTTLPFGRLAKVLWRAGYVHIVKGRFVMPSAFTERPRYLDEAWRRDAPDAFAAAKRRAKNYLGELSARKAVQTDLFGNPIDASRPTRRRTHGDGTPGFNEIKEYWSEQWATAQGRGGTPYPFDHGLDGACLKRLIQRTETVDAAKLTIDNYLACRERWYAGHPLKKLLSDLPKFVAADPSVGADDDLPDLQ